MFSKLIRIYVDACSTIILTLLCCNAAIGQSLNFTTIQYPGLNPVADIKNGILAAAEELKTIHEIEAAAASRSGTVSTYLNFWDEGIYPRQFDESNIMRAHSSFGTNITLNTALPEVLLDLKVGAFNSVASDLGGEAVRETTTLTITVHNGGFSPISREVSGSELISFPSMPLVTSLPISIQLMIEQDLAVDESKLDEIFFRIRTQTRAAASINTLRFLEPADPTKEIPFTASPSITLAEITEGLMLRDAAETAIFTNEIPIKSVLLFMYLVDNSASGPLKVLKDRLRFLKAQTQERDKNGEITPQMANQAYGRIETLNSPAAFISNSFQTGGWRPAANAGRRSLLGCQRSGAPVRDTRRTSSRSRGSVRRLTRTRDSGRIHDAVSAFGRSRARQICIKIGLARRRRAGSKSRATELSTSAPVRHSRE